MVGLWDASLINKERLPRQEKFAASDVSTES